MEREKKIGCEGGGGVGCSDAAELVCGLIGSLLESRCYPFVSWGYTDYIGRDVVLYWSFA
jgi:hypothetical protein